MSMFIICMNLYFAVHKIPNIISRKASAKICFAIQNQVVAAVLHEIECFMEMDFFAAGREGCRSREII